MWANDCRAQDHTILWPLNRAGSDAESKAPSPYHRRFAGETADIFKLRYVHHYSPSPRSYVRMATSSAFQAHSSTDLAFLHYDRTDDACSRMQQASTEESWSMAPAAAMATIQLYRPTKTTSTNTSPFTLCIAWFMSFEAYQHTCELFIECDNNNNIETLKPARQNPLT